MSKTSNKLILILGIISFIFGLLLATPAFARESYTMRSGVSFDADTYSNDRISSYSNQSVIPGCEGRTTGFSTVTGQSCYGNNIGTSGPTTIVRNYNTYNTTTLPATTKAPAPKENVVATATPATDTTASDVNDKYGNLSANALFGSNSFMPTGLIQWVFSILLIVAIIFLWRYVHKSEDKYMSDPMKHA